MEGGEGGRRVGGILPWGPDLAHLPRVLPPSCSCRVSETRPLAKGQLDGHVKPSEWHLKKTDNKKHTKQTWTHKPREQSGGCPTGGWWGE